VLGVVTLAHGLGSLSALAVAPLAPFLLDELRLSRAQVGLLLPAVYLGGVLMSLPAGWLTEWLGVRVSLALGLGLTGVAVSLGALAPGFAALLAALLAAGLGFSVLNPATGKAIYEWFPARERGLAMGVKQAGLTLAGIASALALPPIALASDWRRALLAAASTSLVSAALVAAVYRRRSAADAGTRGRRPRLVELLPLLGRPGVLVVLGCGLTLGIVQSSVLAYLVLYARDTYGLSTVAAARLLALAHLGGLAGRLGWGVASDRLFGGRRRPGLAINALAGAAALVVFALGGAVPAPLAVAAAVLAGAGAFGWVGLYFALMAEVGGARFAGLMTGLGVMFAWGGVLIGPPLFGVLVDATDSYRVAWAGLVGLSLAVAGVLPRLPPLVQR
jgi:sugar phosphate permease